MISAIEELEVVVGTSSYGMDDNIGFALSCFALVIVDVLVVLMGLRKLAVIPLRAKVETERLAIVVLCVGGGVEAAWILLADGAEERAIVHLDDLGFVASLNHGGLAEVPRLATVS